MVSARVCESLKFAEGLHLVLKAMKLSPGPLHSCPIAAVEVALKTLLRGFRDRLAPIVRAQVLPPNFDFRKRFLDILPAFHKGRPQSRKGRSGALAENRGNQSDGFPVRSERLLWEIRGSPTSVRGMIGLVPSGSEMVVGVCDVVDCVGPLTAEEFCLNAWKAGIRSSAEKFGCYRQTYAWVLEKPRYLNRPVSCRHLPGAVIWLRLDDSVERKILKQLKPTG